MRFRNLFFLIVTCLVLSTPAQASMHPNIVVDGWLHFFWHLQMTKQAAMTGNWTMFWQLFTEQSVCTSGADMSLVFTPAAFVATSIVMVTALFLFVAKLMKKAQPGWWNMFLKPAYRYVH